MGDLLPIYNYTGSIQQTQKPKSTSPELWPRKIWATNSFWAPRYRYLKSLQKSDYFSSILSPNQHIHFLLRGLTHVQCFRDEMEFHFWRFCKKSVPNFHFTEFPFLNEMFSEIHPEFPFSQIRSLETICKAFGPCWGQFVVFSIFKVVIFKIQVSNLRFLTLRYVFRKSVVSFHFLKWLWNLLKFPFYRISIFGEI